MTKQERLFQTFGELLYVVAMADGIIQPEEISALNNLLQDHPWAEGIRWSFNYEVSKDSDVEATYKKVIDFCKHYGPAPEYKDFIEAMQTLSKAAEGVSSSESAIITSFSRDLIERFQRDLSIE